MLSRRSAQQSAKRLRMRSLIIVACAIDYASAMRRRGHDALDAVLPVYSTSTVLSASTCHRKASE